jgi:predicted MPP superfamily phosphohydrolase
MSKMPGPQGKRLSIIHISDLHCTADSHTLGQIGSNILHPISRIAAKSSTASSRYITTNRQTFCTNVVVITGDLTDSGDEEDYTDPQRGVLQFIDRLRQTGFQVFSVPGNHDYCKEGNQFLTGQFNEGEQGRRERFVRLATPEYSDSPKYPHVEEIMGTRGTAGCTAMTSLQPGLRRRPQHRQGQLGDSSI